MIPLVCKEFLQFAYANPSAVDTFAKLEKVICKFWFSKRTLYIFYSEGILYSCIFFLSVTLVMPSSADACT